MKHETARGKILYFSEQSGTREEFGREWFSLTWHEDGQVSLRAQCEIEAGVVAARDVLREVIYTMDAQYRPLDCYNRLHQNGKFLGAGWLRFSEQMAECDAVNTTSGRVTQRWPLRTPALSLGAHPVSCDMMHLPRFDHTLGSSVQRQTDVWMTSLEHDGCSGPALTKIDFDLEYVGRESVVVPAGQFDAHHYRFLVAGALPREHPTEDLWCLPDFTFVKATVGGYMKASFELVEFEPRGVRGARGAEGLRDAGQMGPAD